MPTIDSTVFANVANRILTDFGVAATLTRKPAGTYNPATSTAAATPLVQNIIAAGFPFPARLIDGTMVQVGDQQVFIAPSGVTFDPKPADKLTYNGVDYTVINAKDYKLKGIAVLYELQVRK